MADLDTNKLVRCPKWKECPKDDHEDGCLHYEPHKVDDWCGFVCNKRNESLTCVPVEPKPKGELCKCGHEMKFHIDYTDRCTMPIGLYGSGIPQQVAVCNCQAFAPVEQPIKQENPYKNTEAESYWEDGYEAGKKAKAPSLEEIIDTIQPFFNNSVNTHLETIKLATAILKLWNEEK